MATKDDDPNEAKKMPLLDHLVELRQRLFYSAIALVIGFFGCWFVTQDILDFLLVPLNDAWISVYGVPLDKVIYTSLIELFFTRVKLAFFGALVVTFPILAGQLWAFVAPGLYKHEKSAFLPFLLATPVLFFIGAALLYYLMLPLAWRFFIELGTPGSENAPPIELLPRVAEYVGLVMTLTFAFGLSFQLPVLLTLLAKVGIVTSEGLKRKWRHAVVIIVVVAAIITPPDPISQISLAIPLVLLYIGSIYLARMVEKKRERDDAEVEKGGTVAPV